LFDKNVTKKKKKNTLRKGVRKGGKVGGTREGNRKQRVLGLPGAIKSVREFGKRMRLTRMTRIVDQGVKLSEQVISDAPISTME